MPYIAWSRVEQEQHVHSLRLLGPYLRRHRKMLMVGFLIAAIGSAISTIPPYLLRRAIDDINARGVELGQLVYFGLLIVGRPSLMVSLSLVSGG